MNKEQDHASDSDESDEDFCPDNVNEEDVSGDEEEDDDESELEEEDESSEKKAKASAKSKVKNKVKDTAESSTSSTRSTRQTEAKQNGRAAAEKDELESDEEADKSRSDALWADFLGDVKTEPSKSSRDTKPKEKPPSPVKRTPPATSKASEVLEFAGEPVKSVPSSSAKENQEQPASVSAKEATPRPPFGVGKRPANGGGGGGGGLGSLLNQLGKKKKLSVLEKSQMDWKSFKSDEGIDEELRTHNKGKDGYLERQDFLQRTDLRQFEIEKGMRQSRRQN
ncbi:hypothetical protein KR215_011886 [Drosophila sulfurigaster]|nr:hypothetical protein KR215_011886 [Drosophila sulfurigaster]